MTQSKTSLILNNLVELTVPTCTDSKYLSFSENKGKSQIIHTFMSLNYFDLICRDGLSLPQTLLPIYISSPESLIGRKSLRERQIV